MATQRKTSNDYAKELHKLELDKMALEKRIRTRAEEMCKANPDVVIGKIEVLNTPVYTKDYVGRLDNIDLDSVFGVMKIIEEDLKAKHPHKQTTIEFPKTQHEKLMNIAKSIQALNI